MSTTTATELKMDHKTEQEIMLKRPGVLVIGAPNVGKRTLLSRLLSLDFEDDSDSPDIIFRGWTINTKYYTADVSIWTTHLHEGFSPHLLPNFDHLTALVMVFDMNDLSTLTALKEWVSHTSIQDFDILLCIGNKVDLVPDHPAHIVYKRHLQKQVDSSVASDAGFEAYGIAETKGSSLLDNEESSWGHKSSFLEWFTERNIEFIEACASNADFDKCLSVDGDSQGVERLYGALTAYMWPGMVLKTGNRIIDQPSLPECNAQSEDDEDSEYELDYEILSGGSAEAWDDTEDGWVSAPPIKSAGWVSAPPIKSASLEPGESSQTSQAKCDASVPEASTLAESEHNHGAVDEQDKGTAFEFEDLEQLLSEIGNVRDNLRLMPDFQRREMAATLAMRMATMFGEEKSDNEDGFE